jgi:hypothetical protein
VNDDALAMAAARALDEHEREPIRFRISSGVAPVRRGRPPRPLYLTPTRDAAEGPSRFTPATVNRKLAPIWLEPYHTRERPHPAGPYVSSTSVSISKTCPSSCAFKDRGCYAQEGFTSKSQRTMDAAARELSTLDVIRDEVRKIDAAFGGGRVPRDGARGGRDLRLHVGGDVGNARGAIVLAAAARRWRDRGGGAVWTFTHHWRSIPRALWGGALSVLASCETASDVREARAAGYPVALTVPQFPDGDEPWTAAGLKIVPCAYETRGRTCAECRLCLDRDLVDLKIGIGFAVHGRGSARAAAAIRDAGLVQLRARAK